MQLVLSEGPFIALVIAIVVVVAIVYGVPIKVWKSMRGFGVETTPTRKSRRRQDSKEHYKKRQTARGRRARGG
jgi:hypothetical protein